METLKGHINIRYFTALVTTHTIDSTMPQRSAGREALRLDRNLGSTNTVLLQGEQAQEARRVFENLCLAYPWGRKSDA